MKLVRSLLAVALALSVAGLAHAAAKKQSAVNVRFYQEAGQEGGDFSQKVELISSKRSTFMAEMPLLTEREITAYYPFKASDGSYGTYFKLDDHGTDLLAQNTMSRRGSYLLVFFNGRHVVDLYDDRPVQDGIAVIPNGLSSNDLALLDMTFPVIGHENEKPSSKKKTGPPIVAQQKSAAAPTPNSANMPKMSPAMVRQPDGTLAPAQSMPGSSGPQMPAPVNAVGQ